MDEDEQLMMVLKQLAQGVLAMKQRLEFLEHRVKQLENAENAPVANAPVAQMVVAADS